MSDVNLTIQQGEFFVLVGPSGSGKTTTLKMINRLIEPTTGEVAFNEQAVTNYPLRELRLKIGYVLQQIALFPNLTVAENIELIPEMKKWPKEQRRERTIELLKKVQLDPEEYLHRKPAALSNFPEAPRFRYFADRGISVLAGDPLPLRASVLGWDCGCACVRHP